MKLEFQPLENSAVRLEPLAETHREGLRAAAHSGVDWTVFYAGMTGPAFEAWFEHSLKSADPTREHVYAVRDRRSKELVGSSRFLNIAPEHARVEIGATWYARAAQGSAINPATKLLLFGHAFSCGANRVELKVDARNARSRAAVLKLGAKEEGILRRHMIHHDGYVRDSVYFSVIAEEWPKVRAGLEARINTPP